MSTEINLVEFSWVTCTRLFFAPLIELPEFVNGNSPKRGQTEPKIKTTHLQNDVDRSKKGLGP